MKLVETIQLNPSKQLSFLCHQAKNLYNLGNYYINNYYDVMDKYLNWYDTEWILKTSKPFKQLPSQVAQNVLKMLHLNWKSYFESLKDWKKNPQKYEKRPRPPKYLKKDGEFVACFNHQHIKIKNGTLRFPKKTELNPIEVVTIQNELQQARIIPKFDKYNLELVYNHVQECNLNLDKNRMIAIDIGVNNLACVVNNIGLQPFAINGRPLKSINHFYNKWKAEAQSDISKRILNECKKKYIGKIYKKDGKLTKNFIIHIEKQAKYQLYATKRMKKHSRIRNSKINDYIHKASRYIVNYCVENNIGTIIIGKNPLWKVNVNSGKKNNQNFVQIPFNNLIEKIQYKADLIGIDVKIITEEYTSLCSFLDDESIEFHSEYKGKRIKRGLFQTSNNQLINADVNGAYNILKKAFPNAISADGIQGAQLHPLRVNLDTKSRSNAIKRSIITKNEGITHACAE